VIVRCFVSIRFSASSQVLAQQSIDWHNSYTSWAIDDAQRIVRCDCHCPWWCFVPTDSRAYSQTLVRQSIDWHNSDTNCTIDGAQPIVRLRLSLSLVVFRVHSRSRASSQVLVQKSIDWHNSDTNWAIDGTPLFVCSINPGGVLSFRLTDVRRRHLANNQLTSTIPTQVAQLTALSLLYVAIVDCPWCFVSIRFTCLFAGTYTVSHTEVICDRN
jgi:hypothetical protein